MEISEELGTQAITQGFYKIKILKSRILKFVLI
jgi:hypothetical protein